MVSSLSLFAIVVSRILKRARRPALVLLAALALLPAATSFGDIVYSGSSTVFTGSNAAGLSVRATFTIDPMNSDVLRLLLENTTPGTSLNPAELLTSAYFNVLSGTVVGTPAPLTYQSGSGNVFLALQSLPDRAALYVPPTPPSTTGSTSFPSPPVPPSNLKAINPGDNTWQFRDIFSLVASEPPLKFGVGTVGNSNLSPNGFQGNIVDGFDFGIYVGDVTTASLNNKLLVKNSAQFEFAGFGGFDLSQVSPHMVFGFGTSPEVVISVPEPATLSLAVFGLLAALLTARRMHGGSAPTRRQVSVA